MTARPLTADDCRRVLGVAAEATPENIRQVYLDLVRVWHPDRFQSDPRLQQVAQDNLRRINDAYAFLKDYRPPAPFPEPKPPRTAEAHAPGAQRPASAATATEEPPPNPHEQQDRAVPRQARPFRRAPRQSASGLARAAWMVGISLLCGWGAMRLVSLLQVPVFDMALMVDPSFQPKILAPMRIIDPSNGVRSAADTLTQWARGDVVDLWQPIRPAVRPPADPPAPAIAKQPRDRQSNRDGVRAPKIVHIAAPANGAELIRNAVPPGAGDLRLDNRTALEAIVKLVDRAGNTLRALYVAPGRSATVRSIGVGIYFLHVDLGRNLDPDYLRFQNDTFTPEPMGPFAFAQATSEDGVTGNHYVVALNPR